MSRRTITITGRPPVNIDEGTWPVIASGSDEDRDGKLRCQANRVSNWRCTVRQHEDGRAIVYAVYSYTSTWQGARCYAAKRGVMLPTDCTAETICAAIREVCGDIAQAEHNGEDADRWSAISDDCTADMPAEELA